MGMFDNIIVDANILPDLTQEEKLLLNESKGWQTKNFENILTNVYIVEDKDLKYRHSFVERKFPYKLQIKESEWEEIPTDQRPYPNSDNGLMSLMGSMRETNIKIVDINYTGRFTFYTFLNKKISVGVKETIWYEFIGQAENGKITSIERLKD